MVNDRPAPIPLPQSRREHQRALLPVVCEVRQGMGPWRKLSLDDLSTGGFSIARFGAADPHQPVKIRIPGLQVLSAQVCWQDGAAIGCAFAAPLHDAVFEHLLKQV
jgi:hypothetical protein